MSIAPSAIGLLEAFTDARPSVADRMAGGRNLRDRLPRTGHAAFKPRSKRFDPTEIHIEHARKRVPELVPVRHARMLQSPFAFLRGSAAIMAHDLHGTPVTGLQVLAGGDMHINNFGVYATPERQLVFGINDFDEAHPGAWEWDVKRLVASAVVAGRHIGMDRVDRQGAVRAAVRSYRQRLREFARLGHLALWYVLIDRDELLQAMDGAARKRTEQMLRKAVRSGHTQVLEKMTELVDNQQRIIERRPLIVRQTHTAKGRPIEEGVALFLRSYLPSIALDRQALLKRYRLLDVAMKVVGVGSVGSRAWLAFLQGVDDGDPLFLQVKEAQASVLAPYFRNPQAPRNHGERVVRGQRLIQGSPDIFLGWGELDGRHFYVRQVRDMKGGPDFEPGTSSAEGLTGHCSNCGWALALAHAKSGDPAMLAGYAGKSEQLEDALVEFAEAYADQTERDYEAMQKAVRAGRIEASEIQE
mgnify:FL=1